MSLVTYNEVKNSPEVNAYIKQGNDALGTMGFTEHSSAHAALVAARSSMILKSLGYSEREMELAKIAGYMHDIGNCVNRKDHAHHGAMLARNILKEIGMDFGEIAIVMNAIGNHDESSGVAVNPVSAALILADKTDVRRNRVRNTVFSTFDIHDRVNYAVTFSELEVIPCNGVIVSKIELDESICSMMEYFEIFLQRMVMCRKAAGILAMDFKMTANGNQIC